MTAKPSHPSLELLGGTPGGTAALDRWWARLGGSWSAGRGRRVAIMIAVVGMVGLADLVMTILAARTGWFFEANPLAEGHLHSPVSLVLFKLGTMGPACGILLIFRHYRLTELACAGLCAVHGALIFTWIHYYTMYLA